MRLDTLIKLFLELEGADPDTLRPDLPHPLGTSGRGLELCLCRERRPAGKVSMRLILGGVEGCWAGCQNASTLGFTH